MKTFKAEGWIIGRRNLLNQDKIIIFFSRDLGKIILWAKNIQKITSKRLPHAQTGNYLRLVATEKNHYYYLQDTTLISAYSQIKKSLARLNQLYLIFFILDRILPERQPEKPIFSLTYQFLKLLSSQGAEEKDLTNYLNQVLIKLGYIQTTYSYSQILTKIEEIIAEKIPSFII